MSHKKCLACGLQMKETRENKKYFLRLRTCSIKCRGALKTIVGKEERSCLICRKKFICWKSAKKKVCCRGCGNKYISKLRTGENNPMWKGKSVGYSALHTWIRMRKPEPKYCECCGRKSKRPLDLANISDLYLRKISDWEYLCRRCHMTKDGRLKKFKESYATKKTNL